VENRINNNPPIGIIGGVGPYAGLDFIRKIFDNTIALKDQDHVNCILVSCPSVIPDRTDYLLKKENERGENPAIGMFESTECLYNAGVRYASVACNTAHSEKIFLPFLKMVKEKLSGFEVVNMLETSAIHVKKMHPEIKCVGLLATLGTYKSRVYHEYFKKEDDFDLIEPDENGKEKVHEAIYSPVFGIKANSASIKPQAKELFNNEIRKFIDRGAEAVILGCTEIPLAVSPNDYKILIIDPGLIIVRKLIQLSNPEKLLN